MNQNVVDSTHTKQVVNVHNQCILRTPFHTLRSPVSSTKVGQGRFCACTVGVHDVAIFGVSAQNIRDYLTESLGENTFVNVFNGVVYIFFGC